MGMGPSILNGNTGGRQLYSVTGEIDTTGPTVTRGTNFSVAKTGTGDVTITLTSPFGGGLHNVTAIGVAAAGGGSIVMKLVAAAYDGASVRFQRSTDAGALADGVFLFEIIGAIDPF